MLSYRTIDNGHKLKQERFLLDVSVGENAQQYNKAQEQVATWSAFRVDPALSSRLDYRHPEIPP